MRLGAPNVVWASLLVEASLCAMTVASSSNCPTSYQPAADTLAGAAEKLHDLVEEMIREALPRIR